MPSITPKWPTRADHRFLLKLVNLSYDDQVIPRPEEFDRVSRVFSKMGGSWERVFNGSPEDLHLIKLVLKVAVKKGYLTKKEKWD